MAYLQTCHKNKKARFIGSAHAESLKNVPFQRCAIMGKKPVHTHGFSDEGESLELTVDRGLHVVGELAGIEYPEGYRDSLIKKYTEEGVRYPRILQRIGEPNIRKHFKYAEIAALPLPLLDYGCGTGDDLRALAADGYPVDLLTGYDIDSNSVDIGFDFYMDKERWEGRFVVGEAFPFTEPTFSIIYSGSVIHATGSSEAADAYLSNAARVLVPGGIIFGSTLGKNPPGLGRDDGHYGHHEHHHDHPILLLHEDELRAKLEAAGFTDFENDPAIQTNDFHRIRNWFFARKAST